ncbi:MAG: tetratricopeptide repeat protein [Victivallaceae bacterium]
MLKLFCIRTIKAVAIVFLYCVVGSLNAEDADRLRALGDVALNARDYKRAVNFYRRYKVAAAGNRNALQDASVRLLTAYISSSDVPEAKRELAAFSRTFPLADNNLKVLYQASIFILERKYKEAEEILLPALKNKIAKEDLYFQLLSTLGLSLRRQKRWREAAEAYASLEKGAAGTSWEFTAFQQRLYCLIMGEELIKSKELFAAGRKFSKNADYFQLNLLLLLQMIKEKRFSELCKTYVKVMAGIEVRPNPLVYKISRIAVEHFLKNDKPAEAVIFLKDAFKFAPDDRERRDSLLLLINTYARIKDNNLAIKAALKYIELYYDDPKTLDVQLQCARLMAAEKRFSEALALYTTILKEPRLSPEQRITAAREAAVIYEQNGAPDKAMRMLAIIYEVGTQTAQRMEGKYLQGQLYYKNKEFAEAAVAFEEVMVQESPWQTRGAYWALQSQLHLKDYSKALYIAEELGKDKKDKTFASTGQYYLAYCQEQLGRVEEALKNYRLFVKLYPENKHAPAAVFAAAGILFAQNKFAEAAELLKDFPDKYPKNEFTPNALYKFVFAAYQLQKWDEVEKTVRLLAEKYSDSEYCIAAELWFIDSLRNRGQYDQAEKWIQGLLKKYSANPGISAQLLYDCALVSSHSRKSGQALKLLEEIFDKYPKDNINARALFLAGDIASGEGDYAAAAGYYQRAARLRPQSDFEIACLGRMADCNYSLYNTKLDPKLLKKASEDYKKLLEVKKMTPSVRNQTKYKLGRCYELLEDENAALDMYNELLYGYQVDQEKGVKIKPVWVVKAATAAIRMYLKMDTPEAAAEAVRVYRLLKKMKLETGENFDGYIKNIQTKYSLEN